jgi:hypothetical protein
MWYKLLLQQLARLICPEQKDAAADFIVDLLEFINEDIEEQPNFEAMFLFGLINALHQYYLVVTRYNNIVSLNQFARHSLGLAILYYKYTDEKSVYCCDFLTIISERKIYAKLGLQREISKQLIEYIEGARHNRNITPFAKIKTFDEYIANREIIKNILFKDQLKSIEREVFRLVDYSVRSDLQETCTVLNDLINSSKNQRKILTSLSRFLSSYKNIDESFDRFIRSVELEKLKAKTLAKQAPELIKVEINLNPKRKHRELSHQDSNIELIQKKLTPYIEKSVKNKLSIFNQKPLREHIEEVKNILEGISNGKYQTIDDVLAELSIIDISNPNDMLAGIRSDIRKSCSIIGSEANYHLPTASSLGHYS